MSKPSQLTTPQAHRPLLNSQLPMLSSVGLPAFSCDASLVKGTAQAERLTHNKNEKAIMSIKHIDAGERMSQIVIHNNTVYLAGQVAEDGQAPMQTQTEQVLAAIDSLLARAGTDKSLLLSATIWVTDMAEFSEMNAAWDAWVTPGRPPVRACVEAALAKPDWKVEISVIAALPDN